MIFAAIIPPSHPSPAVNLSTSLPMAIYAFCVLICICLLSTYEGARIARTDDDDDDVRVRSYRVQLEANLHKSRTVSINCVKRALSLSLRSL